MRTDPHPHPFVRKLQQLCPLSREEEQALLLAAARESKLGPDEDLVRDGEKPQHCTLILEGFACRYKMLPDGKRQIQSFQIAGDFCDVHSLVLTRMDHSIGTITPCRTAIYTQKAVLELTEKYPRMARALWMETLIDAAIYREWLTSLGRRPAYERIAHLLCEMVVRLKAVGLCDDDGCPFPVTQTELGDALGLSTVHVNRTLQQLRSDGLISFKGGTLLITKWDRLKAAGDFSAEYLLLAE